MPTADQWAIIVRGNSAEDRRGARAADDVSQGVWAGNNARHQGESRGRCECREKLCPTHHGWGWAEYGAWAVPQQGRKGSWSRVKPRKGRSPKVSSKAQALQCPLPESILHSPCFQSALQCQLPFLSSALEGRNLTISCPPTHSCLLHCCRLAAPLWSEFPMTPSPTSEARTPPRPFDPPAPPWLLAHSFQPWPICPLAPLDSLVPPAPPWSGIDPPVPRVSTRPAAPRPFVPLAPSGSFIPSAPPQSSVAPLHHGYLDPHLHLGRQCYLLRRGPPDPPCCSFSMALCLRLRLLLHLLHHCWSAPWSRRPFLLHYTVCLNLCLSFSGVRVYSFS